MHRLGIQRVVDTIHTLTKAINAEPFFTLPDMDFSIRSGNSFFMSLHRDFGLTVFEGIAESKLWWDYDFPFFICIANLAA